MEWITIVGSKQANSYRGNVDDISSALTSAMGMGGGQIPLLTDATIEETKTELFIEQIRGHMEKEKKQIQLPPELQGQKFRIRKLTPRECFRLMDVEDADIDKMQESGLSNSAQYKLAGNSIVVSCLYHIFRKMFIETGQENNQLTLF